MCEVFIKTRFSWSLTTHEIIRDICKICFKLPYLGAEGRRFWELQFGANTTIPNPVTILDPITKLPLPCWFQECTRYHHFIWGFDVYNDSRTRLLGHRFIANCSFRDPESGELFCTTWKNLPRTMRRNISAGWTHWKRDALLSDVSTMRINDAFPNLYVLDQIYYNRELVIISTYG